MPILERDPWRDQYFTGVACPEAVTVPTDDGDAYELFPRHRWVYNKLLIGDRTTIEHFDGPHMIHGVGTYEFLKEKLGWQGKQP